MFVYQTAIQSLFNNNIRCIEIENSTTVNRVLAVFNNNIRCIEMVINGNAVDAVEV